MLDENLPDRAERLLARLDALAEALVASGASDEAASRLLASASAAVLQALALDELVAAAAADRVTARNPEPVTGSAAPGGPDVPLAA